MKKIKVLGGIVGVLVIVLIFTLLMVEKVPTGYVGVVYNMSGGVNGETLSQGFHIVSPTKHVKTFSIGNEQLILSKDKREGSEGDDSFLVSTSDNANISISFQMSYRYKADSVVDTYKKFKGMNGEDIVNQRVKTVLKSKISEITSQYTMMDIYSGNRSKINAEITKYLENDFTHEFGIEVLDASIIDVHPDKQLEKAIKDRVTAMQKKQQAQAEQETVKVENETALLKAQNEAEKLRIQTEAEANRYTMLSNAITDKLLAKWEMDARLQHGWVTVQGGTPIVNATNN